MAAQHAIRHIGGSHPHRPAHHPGPLAADTDTGFARFFMPALLAAVLTTACLAWESWHTPERPQTVTAIARLSF